MAELKSLLPETRRKNERRVVINKRLWLGWINDKYEAGLEVGREAKGEGRRIGGRLIRHQIFLQYFMGKAAIRQSLLRYLINGYF